MTSFILILCGLVLGAICLGAGYLLGKKNKVKAQLVDAITGDGKAAEAKIAAAAAKAGQVK